MVNMIKRFAISSAALLLLACSLMSASAETIMNGREVTAHMGRIVMHNERTHQIEIKTEEHSSGTWKIAEHIVVLRKGERLALSDIWGKTKRVRAWVSKAGVVERIDVLEWKD